MAVGAPDQTNDCWIRFLEFCEGIAEYQERPWDSILDRESARQLESREPLC